MGWGVVGSVWIGVLDVGQYGVLVDLGAGVCLDRCGCGGWYWIVGVGAVWGDGVVGVVPGSSVEV